MTTSPPKCLLILCAGRSAARDILVHALDGSWVEAVNSGEEWLTRACDVIFMDSPMPGMEGIEAAHLIKEDTRLKAHPDVVLVTPVTHPQWAPNLAFSKVREQPVQDVRVDWFDEVLIEPG
jgi:CheY-like chemotaxis protein